ncbi:MAG: RNA polymerase sigma factor [Terriglobales bacterium]
MSTPDTTFQFSGAMAISPAGDAAAYGEQALARELRAGSVEAFNYLISLYHQPLYRFILRLTGQADDVGDILQDVFLKVFRSAAHFEGRSSVKTWLYQIALHEASNHRRWWHRHKRREMSLEAEDTSGDSWAERLPDGGESPLSQAMREEQGRQLQHALQQVPEPFHSVLVLREVEGFSYDEIAAIVGVRVGTVKSRLLRGREMLRQRWLCDNSAPAKVAAAGFNAGRAAARSEVHG